MLLFIMQPVLTNRYCDKKFLFNMFFDTALFCFYKLPIKIPHKVSSQISLAHVSLVIKAYIVDFQLNS